MRILNEADQEITQEQADTELGHLEQDYVTIAYHDPVPAVDELGHTGVTVIFQDGGERDFPEGYLVKYFTDREFTPPEDDKDYGRPVKEVDEHWIIDQEYVPAEEGWFENEEILRYILFTDEELAEIEEQKRIQIEQAEEQQRKNLEYTTALGDINNLLLVNANAVGGYSETEAQVGDLTLVMADLIGA